MMNGFNEIKNTPTFNWKYTMSGHGSIHQQKNLS